MPLSTASSLQLLSQTARGRIGLCYSSLLQPSLEAIAGRRSAVQTAILRAAPADGPLEGDSSKEGESVTSCYPKRPPLAPGKDRHELEMTSLVTETVRADGKLNGARRTSNCSLG